MEFVGEYKGISIDWETGKRILSFETQQDFQPETIESIKSGKLSITVKKFRQKRSLDANAYCWAIITKIANHPDIKSSKEEVYEEMLQKYGFLYQDEEGYIPVTVKAGVDMSKIEGHWKFYKSNGKFDSYLMIKGSSEYDTAEMAHFIDMVVQEAKELGIETLTPIELERMKIEWRKD